MGSYEIGLTIMKPLRAVLKKASIKERLWMEERRGEIGLCLDNLWLIEGERLACRKLDKSYEIVTHNYRITRNKLLKFIIHDQPVDPPVITFVHKNKPNM